MSGSRNPGKAPLRHSRDSSPDLIIDDEEDDDYDYFADYNPRDYEDNRSGAPDENGAGPAAAAPTVPRHVAAALAVRKRGAPAPDDKEDDDYDYFADYNPRDYEDNRSGAPDENGAGPAAAALTGPRDVSAALAVRKKPNYGGAPEPDDNGAGPADSPEDYWARRMTEMADILESQKRERDAIMEQIRDLMDIVKGIDSRIIDTEKAQVQLEYIIRKRSVASPKGVNYLSPLILDMKNMISMYLTGLDLAHLSEVDRSWHEAVSQPMSAAKIQREKDRWSVPLEKVVFPATDHMVVNFTWYKENIVRICSSNRSVTAMYDYAGGVRTTRLGCYYNSSNVFYGGEDYLYFMNKNRSLDINYAKWGDEESRCNTLERSCQQVVFFQGHLYVADDNVVCRFTDHAGTMSDQTPIIFPEATKHGKTPKIVTFALSAPYVLIALSTKVQLWERGPTTPRLSITVPGVKSLALSGSTICIQKSDQITLYGDDGQPKRVYPTTKLRIYNPLGHVDGSFLFELEQKDVTSQFGARYHGPFKLFRLARYAEYDKLFDEEMKFIECKQYSTDGKLGVFITPAYPDQQRPYLYVNRSG